jgi:hypothetical protein
MVTPEIISYIQSQLAAGFTRESLTSSLAGQGWTAQDIQSAFNAISAPISAPATPAIPVSQSVAAQSAVVAKGGLFVGKIILWIFALAVVSAVGVGVYFVYGFVFNHNAIAEPFCKVMAYQVFENGNNSVEQKQHDYGLCFCEVNFMLSGAEGHYSPIQIVQGVFNLAFNDWYTNGSATSQYGSCNPNATNVSQTLGSALVPNLYESGQSSTAIPSDNTSASSSGDNAPVGSSTSASSSISAADVSGLKVSKMAMMATPNTGATASLCYSAAETCSPVSSSQNGYGLLNNQGALEYCQNLNEDGHTDWRLPTVNELLGIYNENGSNGDIYSYANYWSSTLAGPDSSEIEHYTVDFSNGLHAITGDQDPSGTGVVCVRP